jgi:hypothetical protein
VARKIMADLGLQKIVLSAHCTCWWEAEAWSLPSHRTAEKRGNIVRTPVQWMQASELQVFVLVVLPMVSFRFIRKIPRREL